MPWIESWRNGEKVERRFEDLETFRKKLNNTESQRKMEDFGQK